MITKNNEKLLLIKECDVIYEEYYCIDITLSQVEDYIKSYWIIKGD